MNIRIAAIGSESMLKRVGQYVKDLKNVEWMPYVYHEIEESPNLVRNASEADVLLFTGSLPYDLAEEEINKKKIPAVFIPLDEYIFSLTLFNLKYNLNVSKFSIDISDSVDIKEIFDEISLDINNVFIKDLNSIYTEDGKIDYEKMISFHEDLWKEGKAELAVTCVSTVYRALKEKGIPVIRMIHPPKTIKETLRSAITQGELARSKKAQIVVGVIAIEKYQEQVKDKGRYLMERNALLLHQLLLDFSIEIHASLQRLGKEEFIVYGTTGAFEAITDSYNELTILHKIDKLLEINVNIGFGFGLTTKEAENNAQIALKQSEEFNEKNSAYIVSMDRHMIGPLTHQSISNYKRTGKQNQHDIILFISEKSGINMQNIRKIIEFSMMRNFRPFNASELAEYMQISRRGAERFIKVLVDSDIAKVSGEEKISQRGRPTSQYQLYLDGNESDGSIKAKSRVAEPVKSSVQSLESEEEIKNK